MKKILLLIALTFTLNAVAQKTGTYSFELILTGDEESDTMNIDIHLNAEYFSISTKFSYEVHEKLLVDKKNKRVLELIDDSDENKEYYNSFWETSLDEVFFISESSEFLSSKVELRSNLRFETEKKMKDGFNCQKITLFDEERTEIGTGWVALGLHLEATEEVGFFDMAEGTIISFDIGSEEVKSSLRLIAKSPKVINPNAVFSSEIPEGYIDGDELLLKESGEGGEYEDEEE